MSATPLRMIPPTSAHPPIVSTYDASDVLLLHEVPNRSILGDIRDELGRYQHPQDGPNEFWYNCTVRKRVVYLWFNRPFIDQQEIRDGMKYAFVNDLDGVTVKANGSEWGRKLEFAARPAKPLEDGAFNADYRTVDFGELTTIFSFTRNVHVVTFQGAKYVHKSTYTGSLQNCFEKEFNRYVKIQHCQGIPSLAAVVKRDGMIRGLLISYIDGENLGYTAIKSESELLDITYKIISIAASLESVGYYHEDLKCENIIRRRYDGAIYFIDFEPGQTDDFYPEEARHDLIFGRINSTSGIYILGKTLWQLWTDTRGVPQRQLPENISEPARSIIYDCCIERNLNSIAELQEKWCPKI